MADDAPKPRIKECTTEGDPMFGAVAVRSTRSDAAWLVGHPLHGAQWETTDDLVTNWETLK